MVSVRQLPANRVSLPFRDQCQICISQKHKPYNVTGSIFPYIFFSFHSLSVSHDCQRLASAAAEKCSLAIVCYNKHKGRVFLLMDFHVRQVIKTKLCRFHTNVSKTEYRECTEPVITTSLVRILQNNTRFTVTLRNAQMLNM